MEVARRSTGVYFDETVARGRVYFLITLNKRFVKIGYTNNPKRRNRNLQRDSHALFGCKAKMLGYFPGTTYTERWLHHKFQEYREHGDWFYATPALLAYIENLGLDQLQRRPRKTAKRNFMNKTATPKLLKQPRKFVQLPLAQDLLRRIDDFRFKHWHPSRISTILAIIELGLQADRKRKPKRSE